MTPSALVRLGFVAACVTTSLLAQVPSHATRLNPTTGWYDPHLVRAGNTIHACGFVAGPSALNWVHYARSDDGGRTWPVVEMPLALVREYDDIAVDGDLVVVLVKSQFFGPHTVTSTDGGVTWALPVRVSQQSGISNLFGARLHVAGTTVSVCWYEDRAAGWLWFNQSTDGGFTWRAVDERLDVGVAGGQLPGYGNSLNFAVDGNTLNVIWDPQGIPSGGIHQQRSVDGGSTWLPAARFLAGGVGGSLVADGATLFFVEMNGVIPTIWRSGDGGSTWTQVTNHGLQSPRGIAIDGSRVMLVAQSGTGVPILTSVSVSQDGGQTWLVTQGLTPSNTTVGAYPTVAGTTFYLHFLFFNGQQPAGFVMHSDGSGTQWRQMSGEVGARLFAGPDSCIVTTRPPLPGTDLHTYVFAGHSTVGTGTPGTGAITPELAGSGVPLLGSTFALELRRARGGSFGLLGVAFAAPINVPLGAAQLHLQSPIVPFSLLTTGASGTPAAGSFSLPISIPTNASFVGLPFVSQAFVVDPAAAGGFATTPAIETWIR